MTATATATAIGSGSKSETEAERRTDPKTVDDQSGHSRQTCGELLTGAIGPNKAPTLWVAMYQAWR